MMITHKEYRQAIKVWEKSFGIQDFLNGFKQGEKPMECRKELEDLKEIYEKGLKNRKGSLEEILPPLAHYAKQFIDLYEGIDELESKLENVNEKLGRDGGEDE